MIDVILLDDDPLVHLTWKLSARRVGASLRSFENTHSLFKALQEESLRAKAVYIDSHLGKGIRGEDVARELWEEGFKEIYLTTGYSSDYFVKSMPWIKAILGKEPIWDGIR